jgi:hypothetical protein
VRRSAWLLLPLIGCVAAAVSRAQEPPTNAVEALQGKLARGEITLAYADDGHGYLESLLKALKISPESQVLPFTRSSLQFDRISPKAPRAVYFNDDVAVGAVHDGGLIEIIASDAADGAAFYTLSTARSDHPRLERQGATCMACHGMVNQKAPGWIVASITAGDDGTPFFADPAHPFDLTDQTTPFEKRWGGWYVSGTSPGLVHRGNVTAPDPFHPFEMPAGETLASLAGRFAPHQTLRATSDIVALMTLEHQSGFINRAGASNADPSDAALDALADYMTFADEVALPAPVSGDSGFAAEFSARGPRDAKGRSLRAFDLKTRLFRYPLSYMIYSDAFDALKPQIKQQLWRRLHARLERTAAGRDAIAIVAATRKDRPDDWK